LTGLRGYARISIGRETPGQSVKPERTTDMSNLTVKTNNVPRLLIDAYELSEKERAEFDYLDWQKIDAGEDSATFFRYKGQLFDLGNSPVTTALQREPGFPTIFLNGMVICPTRSLVPTSFGTLRMTPTGLSLGGFTRD
jgi:hypothetical protein